jgi:hypothetical protein
MMEIKSKYLDKDAAIHALYAMIVVLTTTNISSRWAVCGMSKSVLLSIIVIYYFLETFKIIDDKIVRNLLFLAVLTHLLIQVYSIFFVK